MKKLLPTEDELRRRWNNEPDLRAEFGDDFEAFAAYTEADVKGLIKFYRSK